MNFLRGFLDNNSAFGKLMTRCGILIAANLLFVLCCIPVVTVGAGWAALYYVMFKVLYRDPELNPFRTFWAGLKENWRQATLLWLAGLALGAFLYLEQFWCSQAGGVVGLFRYGVLALLLVLVILACYTFPTLSVFRCTLPQLLKNCVYFAVRRPVTLVLVLCAHVLPVALTLLDRNNLPLYGFLWCMFGFSAVAMFSASLLLKLYRPYLEPQEEDEPDLDRQALEDMKKLDL